MREFTIHLKFDVKIARIYIYMYEYNSFTRKMFACARQIEIIYLRLYFRLCPKALPP